MRVSLEPLDPQESTELVEALLGQSLNGDRDVPAGMVRNIVARSDGIPLFLEECARSIREHTELEAGGGNTAPQVPETLQDSLNSRLDQLGDARILAQVGAVFGDFFTCRELEVVTGMPQVEVDRALLRLLEAAFVERYRVDSHTRYRFRHGMFRDAAYNSLLRKVRQEYHARIARLLEHPREGVIDRGRASVAYHLESSGNGLQAARCWNEAAARALTTSSLEEAEQHLERGFAAIRELPLSAESIAVETRLLLRRAVCLTLRSGYHGKEVAQAYSSAADRAGRMSAQRQLWIALYGLWRCHVCQGEFTQALSLSVRMRRIARDTGMPFLVSTTTGIHAMTRLISGKFMAADRLFSRIPTGSYPPDGESGALELGQDPHITISGLGAVNHLLCHNSTGARVVGVTASRGTPLVSRCIVARCES